MSDTMDTMTEVEADVLDPEMVLLLTLIDTALIATSSRSLIPADEMTDALLDIRAAALALNN